MKLTKRSLTMIVAVMLCAAMTIGGTLAFLTDTDSKVNTFTMGNVDIKLAEKYEDAGTLMPGVTVEKEAWIENVGTSDAWVFMSVATPAAQYEDGSYMDYLSHEIDTTSWTKMDVKPVTIEGKQYQLYIYQYSDVLQAGTTTPACLKKITMHPQIDYDPISNEYKLIAGGKEVVSGTYDLAEGKVYVNAYAIQTEGFADAKAAYEAYVEQWGEIGETQITLPSIKVTPENFAEELQNAAPNQALELTTGEYKLSENAEITNQFVIPGGEKVTLDLNGGKLDGSKAHPVVVDETGAATIKNGSIDAGANAGVVNNGGTIELENCTIENESNQNYALVLNGGTTKLTNCTVDSTRGGIGIKNGAELIVISGSVTARDYYPLYIEDGKATFTNTTLVRANQSKARNMIYHNDGTTATFTGCTFTSERPATSTKTVLANNYTGLTFNNCTYNNVDTTGLN